MLLELDTFQIAPSGIPSTMNTTTGNLQRVGKTGQRIDPQGVDHPSHYNEHPSGIECIEIKRHLSSNLGDSFKYVFRRGDKGDPVKDLNKSIWYLRDEIEHLSEAAKPRLDLEVLAKMKKVIDTEEDSRAKAYYQAMYDYLIDLTPSIPRQAQLVVVLVAAQRLLHTYQPQQDLGDI